jgi:hypothetical protein
MITLPQEVMNADFIFTSGMMTEVMIQHHALHSHLDYGIKRLNKQNLSLDDCIQIEELCFFYLNQPKEDDFFLTINQNFIIYIKKIDYRDHISRKNEILYGNIYLSNGFYQPKNHVPHLYFPLAQEEISMKKKEIQPMAKSTKSTTIISISLLMIVALGIVAYFKRTELQSQINPKTQVKIIEPKAVEIPKYIWSEPQIHTNPKILGDLYKEYGKAQDAFKNAALTFSFLNEYIILTEKEQKQKLVQKYLCDSQDEYMDENKLNEYLKQSSMTDEIKEQFEMAFKDFQRIKKSMDCSKIKTNTDGQF